MHLKMKSKFSQNESIYLKTAREVQHSAQPLDADRISTQKYMTSRCAQNDVSQDF